MKIELWMLGKTQKGYLETGIQTFDKRLKRYLKIEQVVIPDIKGAKSLTAEQIKEKEADDILSRLKPEDYLILLDEKGAQFTSVDFAEWLNKKLQTPNKRLIFLVGGAYGVSESVKRSAQFHLAFSKMTFSHQMIRLFVMEQLYRAVSILHHLPYHNE